jgi:exosortase
MASHSPELATTASTRSRGGSRLARLEIVAVVIGISALLLPTLVRLATEYWSTDNGVHGPLILVSGAWLIWRERAIIHFRPGSISGWWLLPSLPLFLLLYAYGRIFDVLIVETSLLYAILVLIGFYYWGPTVMRRLWFAIIYLAFLIRPPSELVAELTQPLKIWLSGTAVSILHGFGYPVGNTGVSIQIAQYELLVQQACAGLGSIFSLLAIGLLYLHLSNHQSRLRAAILLLAIIPIAVLANLIRVLGIVLLTYYAGNDVAQGFAHDVMGLTTFAVAILGMLVLDGLLGLFIRERTHVRVSRRRSRRRAYAVT